jgi:DegV family protein with EDD domain
MRQVRIVTDSNCQLPESLCQELGIRVVHLPYAWDDRTYIDRVDMGPRTFYTRLRESKNLPTTSAPTPGSFRDVFEELATSGDPILLLHVGSEFSSTYKTAALAKEMLPNKKIYLHDSHGNGMGLGFQVLAVARAAREGRSIEELIALAEEARGKTGILFAVKDLTYLQRGGRITLGERILAQSLNLVPIFEIHNSPIKQVDRVRSFGRAIERLVALAKNRLAGSASKRIGIVHADNEADAYKLRSLIEKQIQPHELILEELSPILGTHTGPGAVGLAYSVDL